MKVLYTGSFNPFHKGHEYVFNKAKEYFGADNVFIGIGCNPAKPGAFNNLDYLKWSIHPVTKNVLGYATLTATFCDVHKFNLIVRGIRPGKSLEYEEDLSYWNMKLGGIDTIFIPTPPEINQISSSVIRELDAFNKNDLYPELLNKDIYFRWKQKKLPEGIICFGKSCVGKSHYLNDHNWDYPTDNYIDCDVEIWQNLDLSKDKILKLKKDFVDAIQTRSKSKYETCIKFLSKYCDWAGLLHSRCVLDAAVIGCYWNYIPLEILSKFTLCKFTNTEANRIKYAKKKGWSENKLKYLDMFYQDPPYWDTEIDLSKEH